MTRPLNLLWFKRDLRLRDHAPLLAAVRSGAPFAMLYCFEPELMASPKHDPRHWRFVAESIADLQRRGWPVIAWWGGVEAAFTAIAERAQVQQLFSHQETGHELTFRRDQRVRAWCRENKVDWRESVQDAVIRGRKHRRGFADHVDNFLARPRVPSELEAKQRGRASLRTAAELNLPVAVAASDQALDFRQSQVDAAVFPLTPGVVELPPLPKHPHFQPGGETVAWRYLKSFLTERGQGYARQIGNPALSRRSCSRMSTYLAWGCVSVREVFQWARSADVPAGMRKDLKMFRERLWWRAHYYQKLEAEYQIEQRPINPWLSNLDRTRDRALLHRFTTGTTGFPMIDAGVRCLTATGWVNFRTRAMLVTFATFILWLDWRPIATFLGSQFLDYDPGIHYGQFQMQAGLTGYHPPRNYNPYLQGERQDPDGTFVHEWLPELRHIPAPWCHYPHRLTALERTMYGFDESIYPAPLVDFATAAEANMERYWAIRNAPEAKALLPEIWKLHCLPESEAKYLAGEVPSPRRAV